MESKSCSFLGVNTGKHVKVFCNANHVALKEETEEDTNGEVRPVFMDCEQ